jgi:undecaprenyl pyrophosphate synthase
MSLGISSGSLDKSSDYIPYKTTLELGAERKIAQVKAKLNVLSNLDKVNVKFEESGFLKRRKARVENYDDFIENLYVKGLGREEIYYVLKDLEKIAEGELDLDVCRELKAL